MARTLKAPTAGVALSVTGSSHLRGGRGGDDACRLRSAGGAWLVAVADGAGSAPRAAEGSNLVASTAASWLMRNPITAADSSPEKQLRRCLAVAHTRLRIRAETLGCEAEELATTLLVAIVRPKLALAIGVGDGAIVVRDRERGYLTLHREQKTGAANVSDFVTDDDYAVRATFTRLEGRFDALAGMTDGLEPLAFTPDRSPFAPFFDPLLACAKRDSPGEARRRLKEFLTCDRLRAATDDDLTLVLAHLEDNR
jgi:hypothetical protein